MADNARPPEPLVTYWEWQTAAACRGMDSSLFFHPPKERKTAKAKRITTAKAICRDCPARQDCAAHALRVREPYGVWGGLSEDERAELLGVESLKYPQKINAARQ